MRIVRFSADKRVRYGVLEETMIFGIKGSPFSNFDRRHNSLNYDGSSFGLDDVRLLAPCNPSKIICLGLNYRNHAEETKLPLPTTPLIFMKPSTAVIGPDKAIILPINSRRVDYEGELGVVIGKKARHVSKDKFDNFVLGYTCVNDVSERYNQKEDGQWTRAKSYDTFAPIGPWVETDINPGDLKIETYLNNELRQSARTNDLIFGVPELMSFITGIMTLLPGDIISTGTPSGIGRMNPGDVVNITIENIGSLRNFVTT